MVRRSFQLEPINEVHKLGGPFSAVHADLILDQLVAYDEDDDDDSFEDEYEEAEEQEEDDEYEEDEEDEVLEDERHDQLEDLSPETAPLEHVLADEIRMKTAPSPAAASLWKVAREEKGGAKKVGFAGTMFRVACERFRKDHMGATLACQHITVEWSV